MREVLKRSSTTDRFLAVFTFVLTITAIFQYVLTRQQLDVQRNDERAWLQMKGRNALISSEEVENSVVEGEDLKWELKMSNVGKTPARHVSAVLSIKLIPADQEVPLQCVETMAVLCVRDREEVGLIFPNAESDSEVTAERSARLNDHFSVTLSEAQAWASGDVYVAVFGIVDYDDVFDIHHRTRFCYWRNDPKAPMRTYTSRSCTLFNTAD